MSIIQKGHEGDKNIQRDDFIILWFSYLYRKDLYGVRVNIIPQHYSCLVKEEEEEKKEKESIWTRWKRWLLSLIRK